MIASFDWSAVGLVVFDVDGTLYDQGRLRRRMAIELARHAVSALDLSTVRILARYRRIREHLADSGTVDFEAIVVRDVAAATGATTEQVRSTVCDWIERRPLHHILACRYPGLPDLFERLRAADKIIGVLSDYPAVDKLAALELAADFVVSAHDEGVGILKPDPTGLRILMTQAGVGPAATLVVGDRVDRDGAVAISVGAQILIRSAYSRDGWQTFAGYDGPPFLSIASAPRP